MLTNYFFIPTLSISSWEYVPINFMNSWAAFLDLKIWFHCHQHQMEGPSNVSTTTNSKQILQNTTQNLFRTATDLWCQVCHCIYKIDRKKAKKMVRNPKITQQINKKTRNKQTIKQSIRKLKLKTTKKTWRQIPLFTRIPYSLLPLPGRQDTTTNIDNNKIFLFFNNNS